MREPMLDATSFGERDSFHRAHSGVGFEQQIKLRFERNFERIFLQRGLPAIDVRVFGDHFYVAAFGECGSFGDGDGLRGAGGDTFASELVG